ncbi:hypothetical protein D3C86_1844220 [compost metagenome]
MLDTIYDDKFRAFLLEIAGHIQKYDVVSKQQSLNIVESNIDSFEDCFYDNYSAIEAYSEYAND